MIHVGIDKTVAEVPSCTIASYVAVSRAVRCACEVAKRLAATGCFSATRLDVMAECGGIALRGRVTSNYHKQLAQAYAMSVIGAEYIRNELYVSNE